MAKKDVFEYYYHMQAQYLEMQADLADFEQALKDGYITEDKLLDIKSEINNLKTNYDRLSYIVYLLDLPRFKFSKAKYNKNNAALIAELKKNKADSESVVTENKTILGRINKKLTKLTKRKKK